MIGGVVRCVAWRPEGTAARSDGFHTCGWCGGRTALAEHGDRQEQQRDDRDERENAVRLPQFEGEPAIEGPAKAPSP